MFRSVSSKPDLVAQEHELLATWRERRTFARLRAQNAGGPRWSFLDGPITANNPMGVHHAWGRAYKDLYQRFHAMLGEDERFQNGFDCQGLWVEVNVERDLGFTSKRDIEEFGIDRFVTLCKQRVLSFAARQTEQSIRLGMWMDWNDPAELRRLGDLLGSDPGAVTTLDGPDGPVTDSVEMLVGRLGMPELGGSYFTFSNENNDLIWGWLAECHRRGWLYKGHDTMPWCARCGTGHLADGDERGLPGPRGSRAHRRVPAHRPARRSAPRLDDDALDADVERRGGGRRGAALRQGPPGRRPVLGRQGHAQVGAAGPVRGPGGAPGKRPRRLALHGAVRRATGGPRRTFEDGRPYEHRVVAWDEVGEEEGTGIVHIAPGCGAEDFQLGKSLGLPVIAPIDEDGIVLDGFGSLTRRELRDVTDPIVEHLKRHGPLLPARGVSPSLSALLALRDAAVFRLVDEWYITMGPVYDQPRETLTPEQVDASLRYQIMEVVDRIRWIPGFGYERELDWLLQHARLDDQQEALLGPGAADLRLHRRAGRSTSSAGATSSTSAPSRAGTGSRAIPRIGRSSTRSRSPARRAARPSSGSGTSAIPWLDAGIVPFSTLHYREDPDYWEQWFPADFITESFPGQFRNWFYSMLAMSTVLRREPPFKTIFGYALVFGEDGRPMHKSWGNAIDFDEAAERMGVDVMRWLFAKARPEENILFGWHAADEARRELLVLWNVYSFFVTYARLAGWTPSASAPRRRPPSDRPSTLDPVARGRHGRGRRGRAGRRRRCRRDPRALDVHRRPLDLVSAPVARPVLAGRRRRRPRRGVRDAARGARRHRPACSLRSCRSSPTRCTETSSRRSTRTRPDSVHLTRWPAEELGRVSRRAARGVRSRSPGAPSSWPGRCAAQAGIRTRQPLARGCWLALPGGELRRSRGAARCHRATRSTSRRSSSSATTPSSSIGA